MTENNKFGEIVNDNTDVFKRPLYEVDIELLSAMRKVANMNQSMSKHRCFDDPIVLEQKRQLESKVEELQHVCKELDKKYNVE